MPPLADLTIAAGCGAIAASLAWAAVLLISTRGQHRAAPGRHESPTDRSAP